MELHFEDSLQFLVILEDEVGDDCEDGADFGLDDGFPSMDNDGCLGLIVPMMRKKTR